jgi:hypothetical protein
MKEMMMEKFKQFIQETRRECFKNLEDHVYDSREDAITYLQKRRRTLKGYSYALQDMGIFSDEEVYEMVKLIRDWYTAIKVVRDVQYPEN